MVSHEAGEQTPCEIEQKTHGKSLYGPRFGWFLWYISQRMNKLVVWAGGLGFESGVPLRIPVHFIKGSQETKPPGPNQQLTIIWINVHAK